LYYCVYIVYQVFHTWWNQSMLLWNDSEVANIVLRLMGCKIGSQVSISTPDTITEFDLVDLGNDVIVEYLALLQPHTFENRIMTLNPVQIKSNSLVGSHSVVLSGAVVEELCHIEAQTLIMKNQLVRKGSCLVGGSAIPFKWVDVAQNVNANNETLILLDEEISLRKKKLNKRNLSTIALGHNNSQEIDGAGNDDETMVDLRDENDYSYTLFRTKKKFQKT